MAVVYAIPYKPPVPYKPDWGGVTVTWTGWDGSVWNLSDPSGGVFLPQSGVGGLSMPSYTQWTQQSPSVAGQWFRGAVADPRKVFWPIAVYSDKDSSAWLALDSAFWNSMHPEKYGTWTVTNPLGQSRTLRLRFSDDGNNTFDTNPARIGWAVYGINMIADQPFWSGDPVT